MINSIRTVRKARRMTLDDVARRCDPPTTPQTIGRLETGTRTLSLDWLTRIADALGVSPGELVRMPDEAAHEVAVLLTPDGAHAPARPETLAPQRIDEAMLAVRVTGGIGDYRAGDIIWCRRLDADRAATALNRDVLVPRPGGRYLFGRLIGMDGEKLHLLPLGAGARQQVVASPPWFALAARLIREL
ncbi:MAG: helix-turn-helix transcriptional regulator [Sphingomonadales bacterium]|nr:helix-turn-helix transcriptional regulator [Sphingomonadales bacterium]